MQQVEVYTPLQKAVLTMVLLNALSVPIMLSSVNVALPAIAEDLQLSAIILSWIPTAFLMASAMFVLVFGRLADMFGRRKIFLLGAGLVMLASLLAALAIGPVTLLGARFLQGIAAAMLYATQMAIVTSVFPLVGRGRVIGLVTSMIYVGLAAGPLIGGLIVDQFGWRGTFLLQLPIAVMVLYVGLFRVNGEWAADSRGSFDFSGALIYSLSIFLVCVGVSFLPDVYSAGILVAGLLSLVVFFRLSLSRDDPIWDVSLFFTNRVFTFSCLASLIIYSATFMNVVLLSLYLQHLQGLSASVTGLIIMIQPLTMAVFSPFMGKLSESVEPKVLASTGMGITTVGLVFLAMLTSDSALNTVIISLMMTGFGFALFSSPNVNAIMSSVEKTHIGAASAAVSTTRILGQMVSMVLVTLVVALQFGDAPIEPSSFPVLEQAISFCFFLAAGLCLPGIVLSLARGRVHHQI